MQFLKEGVQTVVNEAHILYKRTYSTAEIVNHIIHSQVVVRHITFKNAL